MTGSHCDGWRYVTTMTRRRRLAVLLGVLVFAGLVHAAPTTLYERLGGAAGVRAISDELIERVARDPLLGRSFKDTKIPRIQEKLALQLCQLTGGPCRYDGDNMREVHAGHQIGEAEFYGMVETLRAILRERHVDLRSRNELLRLLAPMKRDVVEPASRATPPPAAQAAVR